MIDSHRAMSILQQYVSSLAHPYLTWQGKIPKPVLVQPIQGVPDLSDLLYRHYFNRFKPQLKACYYNAYKATMYCSGVRYIEGYYINPDMLLPLEHTWNEWRGIQFDVTVEIRNKSYYWYLQVVKLPKEQVREFHKITGAEGCVVHNAHNFYEWMEKGKFFLCFRVNPPVLRMQAEKLSRYLKVKATSKVLHKNYRNDH